MNMTAMRISLGIKLVVVAWTFYAALQTPDWGLSVFYLVVSICFAGLFVFQLDFYRRHRKNRDR